MVVLEELVIKAQLNEDIYGMSRVFRSLQQH